MQPARACVIGFLILGSACAFACIWDSDTLLDERKKNPKLADVIVGPSPAPPNSGLLRSRIQKLLSERRESDPAWWNDLAGAYLRLGEPAEARKLLEPVKARFPADYGIHANLGTAYHLLGHFPEAEREIARGLEINPGGHFGLEIYHLALLRYLNRDSEFQKEHVYLEPWSIALTDLQNSIYVRVSEGPALTNRFDAQFLSATNVLEGAIYMATLNRQQPACWVMLGLLCLQYPQSELNLARSAFQRAIHLGTSQAEYLRPRIQAIDDHIQEAKAHKGNRTSRMWMVTLVLIGVSAIVISFLAWRRRVRLRKTEAAKGFSVPTT